MDLRLFSPYVQTEVGRTQGGKGSGLGLAIVRAIVQLAHGRLGVKSSKNGSTFWLEFRYPLASEQEALTLQEPSTPFSILSSAQNRPVRPGVKPYKNGDSSWSQYSASKQQAKSIAPSDVEKEKPIGSLSLGGPPSGARGSTSQSRQPSVASGPSYDTSNTGMDTDSPFTSEQWQSPGLVERSVLPAMTVTGPTSLCGSQSSRPSTARRTPDPTPPILPAMNTVEPDQALSLRIPSSPPGEEAFTPSTREMVTTLSPQTEEPPSLRQANVAIQARSPTQMEADRPILALVVDDDALTRKLMTRMMTRLGCIVEEAENGQMALDILLGSADKQPRYFDIITLDNMMPVSGLCFDRNEPALIHFDNQVLTGEQAIKHLRAAGRKDLVVGATGNALKADQTSYLSVSLSRIFP